MAAASRAGGRRHTALASLACLAIAATASTMPEPAGAAARPALQLVSVSVDRTIPPGRTVSAKPSCRGGFAFLSSRFHPIAVEPAGAQPDFETLAIVPRAKGATLTFRNVGTASVRIRATADCARIAGRPSLRTTVVSRAVKSGARASSARASAKKALSLVCGGTNSIPGDVGFAARRSGLARLAYFRAKRGRIGVRGLFSGRPAKARLFLSCLHGRGLRLAGQVAGGGQRAKHSAVDGPRATSSGDEPLIVIRFGTNPTTLFADLPFPSLDLAVSKRPRQLWGNPLPAANTGGAPLAGRGFVKAEGSTSARLRWTPFLMRYGIDRKTFEDSLAGSEIVRITPLAVKDRRIPGFFGDFPGGGGGSGGTGGGTGGGGFQTTKTVGPVTATAEACMLGFYIDVYLPLYADKPIEHQILGHPPCEPAEIRTQLFEHGYMPPGTPPGDNRWQNHDTYRVHIKGPGDAEGPFSIKVTWKNPPYLRSR